MSIMAIDEEAKLKPLHIAMFPWLAFGHLIPNLELAKLIAQKGHKVSFISIRGCTEFEPEWFQLLENLHHKPIIPSGQLPSTRFESENESWLWMKEWLDKQPRGRTIYVAFGSEAKLSQEEVNEIALGLEKSKLSFFWVLRVRCGPTDIQMLRLPEGFEERTRGFGVVYTDWAPQMKILDHVAIGGFFTHSGRSSVIEGVQNGKPLILLSFLSDTGLNARVLQEKKMGYCVTRDERDGSFTSDSVAQAIRLVVVDEEGKIYREKIKEMKDLFVNSDRQDKYVDNLLNYLRIPLKH